MKRTLFNSIAALLLAILLACFTLPASAHAASQESEDNHTDTYDYCLRAHDVTIGLSEFDGKTRAELESEIIAASAFDFLIRNTANPSGVFVPITEGYSVDFSSLQKSASSGGYRITVTLPAITMSTPSVVTFRVFVADDLPHPRGVLYTFESGTSGHALPAGVLSQLPAAESILSGTSVAPEAAFPPVRDGAGEWTFSGWSPEQIHLSQSDVTFTGTWLWTALPVYTVSYTFVSGTSGRALPSGVLAKLPMPSSGVEGDVCTPQESFRAFHMLEGTWRFSGWDKASQTITDQNLTFVGEWRWHENRVVVTPASATSPMPETTPTPETTQTPQPSLAPTSEPTASPEAAPIVPVQPPNTPPGITAEGGVKMVLATGLSALVATQAFAIGSDLRVLKWYRAKKEARRANA